MRNPRSIPTLATVLAMFAPAVVSAATLTVGPGQQYPTVSAAVAAAHGGDAIAVSAGTYTNDFPTVNVPLTIYAPSGFAHLHATVAPPNGKAIIVANASLYLNHVELSGAAVSDLNGAGVRWQAPSGVLTLKYCYVHDNQDGVLATPATAGATTVQIFNSEFASNGAGDGYSHGIYANQVALLDVEDSYFHDTKVGHHVKSRANQTKVLRTRLVDDVTTSGTASYDIDAPNGGAVTIQDDQIQQSAATSNPIIVAYGEEGTVRPNPSLVVSGNLLQNFRTAGATGVSNKSSVVASVTGNRLYQIPTLVSGPNTQSGNVTLGAPEAISTAHPWP